MKTQRVISLSLGLVFIVMLVSSGILYFIPDRRVTDWGFWSFLGLDKQQWDNLHINLGILFLILLVWHIYYNWKPIKNYLKEKKKFILLTREFNLSLFLVSLFMVGTITMTFPFNFLVNIGNGIKAFNALDEGMPPFGYAEQTLLRDYSVLNHLDYDDVAKRLEDEGIVFKEKETLKEIATHNDMTPKMLNSIIVMAGNRLQLPSDLPVGIAHKTLHQLGEEYGADINYFIEYMKIYGISTNAQATFKKLAKSNHLHPATLYNMLLASQMKVNVFKPKD